MNTYQGKQLFRVGKIVNTQGLRGELRIIPTTDFTDRFQSGYQFIATTARGEQVEVTLQHARSHKTFLLLQFRGYTSINEVEKWKGGELFVTEDNLAPLEDGEYYFHQLLGLNVLTEDRQPVGVISDILQTGANDVYVIKRDLQKDLLLPAIDECIIETDLKNKQMIVRILPGLED